METLHGNELFNPAVNDIYASWTRRMPELIKYGKGNKDKRAEEFSKEAKLIDSDKMEPLNKEDCSTAFAMYAEQALHASSVTSDTRSRMNEHNSKEFHAIDKDIARENIETLCKTGIKDNSGISSLEISESIKELRKDGRFSFMVAPEMLETHQISKADSNSTDTKTSRAIGALIKEEGGPNRSTVVFYQNGKLRIWDGHNGVYWSKHHNIKLVKVLLVLPPRGDLEALEVADDLNVVENHMNLATIEDIEVKMNIHKNNISPENLNKVNWWTKKFPHLKAADIKKTYKKVHKSTVKEDLNGDFQKYSKNTGPKHLSNNIAAHHKDGTPYTTTDKVGASFRDKDGNIIVFWVWNQKTTIQKAWEDAVWDKDTQTKSETTPEIIVYTSFKDKAEKTLRINQGDFDREKVKLKALYNAELRLMDNQEIKEV